MTEASSDATRLQRLAGYLEQDPQNVVLLADACDTAIACGEHERAEGYIDQAERLGLDPAQWLFRRARVALARRDLPQAAGTLERIRAIVGEQPVIAHDLAYVHLLQGDHEICRDLLQAWVDPARAASLPAEQLQALQLLWLRAMHRLQLLEEAMAWTQTVRKAGLLQPAAAGAASLVALDLEDFASARALADAALAADPAQVEALVAGGSVALAAGDNAQAADLLQRALQRNPEDGRVWSALGMASLQAQDLPMAQAQLERAVLHMPQHIDTWHALGWARLLQGNRPGALQAFREALDLDRNFAESHGAIGLLLALEGDAQAGRHHLEVADRLDPQNVTARYARALLASEAGDVQAVERLVRSLLDRPGFFGGSLGDAVRARLRRAR